MNGFLGGSRSFISTLSLNMYTDQINRIFKLLKMTERLKYEMRHSWLSNGTQESVADHTWQMALLAILTYEHLEHRVDLEKALKMIIIHDIVEAEAGDVPIFETGKRKEEKPALERKAISRIREILAPDQSADEIFNLWYEFEEGNSVEAKFARAMDNLEVQIQHNLATFDTWEEIEFPYVYTKMDKHCCHDGFLKDLCNAVIVDFRTF